MKKTGKFYAAVLFTILAAAGQIAYNFTLIPLFEALLAGNLSGVFRAFLLMAAVLVLMVATLCLQEYFQGMAVADTQRVMRSNIIANPQKYEISNLINDMDLLEKNYLLPYFSRVQIISNFVFCLASLLYLHWLLIVLGGVSFVIMMFLSQRLGPFSKKMIEEYAQDNERFVQEVTDFHQGRREYLLFRLLRRFRHLQEGIFKQYYLDTMRYKTRNVFVQGASMGVNLVAQITNLVACAAMVTAGLLSPGAFLTAGNLVGQLFNSIGELPQLQSKMNGAKALVEKYARETMTQDPQLPVCEKQIALKQIEKAFGAKTIFQNLSVSFTLGQKYRLVGPSGCGKSTLLQMIYGNVPWDGGEIALDGHVQSPYQGAENMAYISEKNYLFEASIAFNMTLGEDYPTDEVEAVAKSCGILNFAGEEGLNYRIEENGENISAGEKQRIILARALLRKKNILLFDEVTSHLDPMSAREIEERILKDPKLTVLFVKHGDVEMDALFDEVIAMDKVQAPIEAQATEEG